MTDRDPEQERALGQYLLEKAAADLRRAPTLQERMAAQLAEGARLKAEDNKEKQS